MNYMYLMEALDHKRRQKGRKFIFTNCKSETEVQLEKAVTREDNKVISELETQMHDTTNTYCTKVKRKAICITAGRS